MSTLSKPPYQIITSLRSTVEYHRKEKLYCVHNSQGEEVLLNSPNKLEALFKLLRYDCSYVANVLDVFIAARPVYFNKFTNKQRLVKAGFVLRDGLLRDTPSSSNYLCVSQSDTGELYEVNADRSSAGNWENFDLELLSSGNCITNGSLVTVHTQAGYYLRATSGGGLDAEASNIGSWEKFTFVNHSDSSGCLANNDIISLKSAHNKYVVAESNGDANANRNNIGSWERFTVSF